MPHIHLSVQDARHLHLAAQGLLRASRRKAVKADVLAAIRRMALLQIDTISVVARSPYLVLYSRLGAYDPAWLDAWLAQGALFEYWAHEACFVPIADYRLLRHRMLDPSSMGWKYPEHWLGQHRQDIEQLLAHIRANGPVRSADFARQEGKGNGWWDWKPEKRHLEVLFTLGRLMVKERRNFQRVYDVTERIHPDWDDGRDLPDPEQARLDMVKNSCRALGVVKAGWVADYYRLKRGRYDEALHRLADEGELIPVRIEGWKHDAFVHAELHDALTEAQDGTLKATATTLLSPFDPVVWDRKRAQELFGFDYRIECYTPAPKRQYGYFVLPILQRGKLVGRLDAKAHRQQGIFEIKALYLEPGVRASARLAEDLTRALANLAAWHGTPALQWGQVPAALGDLIATR
ncbi:MAG: YcaQ family DNA glycosylase [Paludibacterium sp.]|uniref:winged helix-turn-helix domain-containing protein n=1 Tax=Paludibacterium sp. TaxID=1917523 RepID=UPI0025E28ED0|nr:winged helix-turn-helix domain-containing protein [Paludibacterium sp.]MBV8047167.1 YcaQ family DNA glycosylase [Paludibacterium sp.]MBV8649758.1 YcaQ family DNA glycosylase [Paludibacterium sp.]